jgi:asparagine synthase (glutamine-hydrolysing)
VSGLLLIHHRDGRPVERPLAERLLERLDHRGPDGRDVRWTFNSAFGHQHFWTTPEEVGERQPLADAARGVHLALDGRLDNRDELIAVLGGEARSDLADAALLLRAYLAWGEEFLGRLLGPLAVVVLDEPRRRVVCGRDALGDRTLFYYLDARLFAVASEAHALLALPQVSSRADESTLARFFALRPPASGASFFADVRELPPAHGLRVDAEGERLWRHWSPQVETTPRRRSDADHVAEFRSVLSESVRCRLRATAPPAVLMSGGLDSTSVAALAAREVNRTGDAKKILAVSWVFDELTSIDERPYMDAVVAAAGLATLRFGGDDAWPLADLETWPHRPDAPVEGLYCRLHQRAYDVAAGAGRRVLLTGEYGDRLYTGGADWLRDLLREGRGLAAGRELLAGLTADNRRAPGATLGTAVGRALGGRRYGPRPLTWLTPEALAYLDGHEETPPPGLSHGHRERWDTLLDRCGSQAVCLETANAARAGVELRRPYRDRRLVELCLRLPAHLVYRPGWMKWILRQAMAGVLPETVRRRRHPSSLHPLCRRGLVEREAATVDTLLRSPRALWPRYVRPDWLAAAHPRLFAERRGGAAAVVVWRCICLELWSRRRSSERFAAATPGVESLMVKMG